MPIYNGIEFIDDSVQSVMCQTFMDWELIIGVNGHPPESDVYLKAKEYEMKDTRIRVLDLHTIKGKSNALNAMIPYCTYDFVALLDVDDIWNPQKLYLQTVFLKDYDVVGTQCVYFGDRQGTIPKIPLGNLKEYDFSTVNPIINSSVLIKKSLCYWNPDFDGVEDYELWLRLHKNGHTFYNSRSIMVMHRIHGASAFNTQNHKDKIITMMKEYKQ